MKINRVIMKIHSDKGRYLLSIAILQYFGSSPELRSVAFKCILSYRKKQINHENNYKNRT